MSFLIVAKKKVQGFDTRISKCNADQRFVDENVECWLSGEKNRFIFVCIWARVSGKTMKNVEKMSRRKVFKPNKDDV